LPHVLDCFDPAHLGVRFGLEGFRAERTAQGDHELAVLDAGEPFAARDDFVADGALDVFAVAVAGIELTHTISFPGSEVVAVIAGVDEVLRRRERQRKKMAG